MGRKEKKKHFKYSRNKEIITITVRGDRGGTELSMKAEVSNKNKIYEMGKVLRDKYGIDFQPSIDIDDRPQNKGEHFFDY